MPVFNAIENDAYVNNNSQTRTIAGDHDVRLPQTLHTVQDLPNQEKR